MKYLRETTWRKNSFWPRRWSIGVMHLRRSLWEHEHITKGSYLFSDWPGIWEGNRNGSGMQEWSRDIFPNTYPQYFTSSSLVPLPKVSRTCQDGMASWGPQPTWEGRDSYSNHWNSCWHQLELDQSMFSWEFGQGFGSRQHSLWLH